MTNGVNLEDDEEMTTENLIAIRVMQAEYKHLRQLVTVAIGISGVNFIVLLIMILQLSTEIFS